MNIKLEKYLLLIFILCIGCEKKGMPLLGRSDFGSLDGKKVELLTVEFPNKLEAKVTNYGGIITSLSVPDKDGKLEDVVLGYDNLEGYLNKTPYFGALIGRYGNRIAKGKFTLDSVEYTLATNNGVNHLHGGVKGFDKVVWKIEEAKVLEHEIQIVLTYLSKDGEEGYPGNLTTKVTYTFSENRLLIQYETSTDQKTVVNLTQHTYFNLSGNIKESILSHELQVSANTFLPVDSTLIPTGEQRAVVDTPFDFRNYKRIEKDIKEDNLQLAYGLGYDHCWILSEGIGINDIAASLYHPQSGRLLEVFTKEPALQFYSGNFLDGSITGKDGVVYEHRYGLCLETQHYPDSPNKPDFPSVVLEPGERYETETAYKFSTQ